MADSNLCIVCRSESRVSTSGFSVHFLAMSLVFGITASGFMGFRRITSLGLMRIEIDLSPPVCFLVSRQYSAY